MKHLFPTVALVACAVLSAPAAAQEKPAEKFDRPDVLVVLEGGAPKPRGGRVESADYDKVVFTAQGGRKADVPATDVTEIRWGDAPAGYDDGVRALQGGDPASARRGFEDALREKDVKPSLREWVVEFGNAGLGRALLALGEADRAADAFGRARTSNPKSMILDEILIGLAEAELARGKGDAAARAADDLVTAAKAAKRPAWELEAYLVKADGRLRSGDFAGAGAAYDDAIRFAESAAGAEKNEAAKRRLQHEALKAAANKGWALVAKAEASKSTADFDAARSYFDGLATKHPAEPMVRACATNAAGVAKLASGDAKGALRLFMETEVVHFRAATEVARSLWYQAECWKRLGDDRARQERLAELKESYPGSEWARRAP